MTLACSGYNVKRIQDILNQIRVDSGKYVQIDRQRAGILASINKLELKAAALSNERDDIKDDFAVRHNLTYIFFLIRDNTPFAEINQPAAKYCRHVGGGRGYERRKHVNK